MADLEQLKKAIAVLEEELKELREQLDEADANNIVRAVIISQEITKKAQELERAKSLLAPKNHSTVVMWLIAHPTIQ